MNNDDFSMEDTLKHGLRMIELEERLEMVKLSAAVESSCCFDSNTGDSSNPKPPPPAAE